MPVRFPVLSPEPGADSSAPAPASAPASIAEAVKAAVPAAAASEAEPADKAEAKPEAKPSAAKATLDAIRERRAQRAAAKAEAAKPKDAGPAIPADIASAAERWRAYEAAEAKRLDEASKALPAEDRALVDGEKDIARRAALVARLQAAHDALAASKPAAKVTAKPGPTGAPPPATSIDILEALKTPEGMKAAKSADPEGFAAKFSALLGGSARKSTLDLSRPKKA